MREEMELWLGRIRYKIWCWVCPIFWITYIVLLTILACFVIFGVPNCADFIRGVLAWISKIIF